MDLVEVGALLTYASSCDRKFGTPGRQDVIRWADLLDGLTYERCEAAIRKHYRESSETIMPADIRKLARTTTDGDAGAGAVSTPAGEVLCGGCGRVHRRDESCGALVARPWPRPLAGAARAVTAEPEAEGEAIRERALQRARGERGNVAWSPPSGEPPSETHAERPVEERDYVTQRGAITLEDLPPQGLAASSCYACPASRDGVRPVFLDYPAGRSAHREIFRHDPVGSPGAR